MSPDRQLLATLEQLRRQWRLRVLLESLVWILAAVVLAVVASWGVLTLLGGEGPTLLTARLFGYALIAAAVIRGLIMPLLTRASPQRFALYVEERAPSLRQALLAAVQEAETPAAQRLSPSLSERLMRRAHDAIRTLPRDASLERPRMIRAGQWSGALALGAALLLVLGPQSVRDGARVLFMPFGTAQAAVPVRALSIEPGNASVPRGGAIEVEATLVGFAASGAELVFRSDSGATTEWQRLPMVPSADSARFRSRLFDIVTPTEYYVESADVRSAVFRLTVNDMPAVSRVSLDLQFPAYSGLPREHIDDGGDVAAIVGTTVTVHATVTRAVAGGTLRFDDGSTVPLVADSSGRVSGSFRVTRSGFYHVDLRTTDGTVVAGAVEYVVDAIADRAPVVRISEPGRDTKVSNTDEVTIAVDASDDLGVTSLELRYRVNGGAEQTVKMPGGVGSRPREAQGAHTLFLEELPLQPGDLVAYHAVARDGAGKVGSSDVYFLEIRPFGKDYRQSDDAPQQGGGGAGQQGDSPDGFVQRQREIVSATFNWLRDSAATADKQRRQDMTTLAISEGRLRTDVEQLVTRLTERGVADSDTMFAKIRGELAQGAAELKSAEELLGRVRGGDALAAEQRALQRLQRAEAMYRDVQLQQQQQGGGGGGGGGGQRSAEDLADLFELETDKQRNQYETVQQSRP
ncbi:MAG: Ig-like domain-containing protein [Gemmatimonadaceae bacterium]|nr:Ig-like domain-containing protein [Gemmatimonadaceae bacterium]